MQRDTYYISLTPIFSSRRKLLAFGSSAGVGASKAKLVTKVADSRLSIQKAEFMKADTRQNTSQMKPTYKSQRVPFSAQKGEQSLLL